MCEWNEFCEFGDKGDDCDDPDFQNGCEQSWGYSRMDDDRFRREMTARREATKAGKRNFAEKLEKALKKQRIVIMSPSSPRYPRDKAFNDGINCSLFTIDNTLNKSGGDKQ